MPKSAHNTVINNIMFATDVFPTLTALAGLPPPAETDGVDQSLTLLGMSPEAPAPRDILVNVGVNPMGGFADSLPGVESGSLNLTAMISWPYKLIFGESQIRLLSDEPWQRSGYYSCDANGYKYHEQQEGQMEALLEIPTSRRKYRRTGGKPMKAWLFNIEEDVAETNNLLLSGGDEERKRALEMVAKVEALTTKRNGWVPEQSNLPSQAANPACHNWTWMPGPWSWQSCLKQHIKNGWRMPSDDDYESGPEVSELIAMGDVNLGGALW